MQKHILQTVVIIVAIFMAGCSASPSASLKRRPNFAVDKESIQRKSQCEEIVNDLELVDNRLVSFYESEEEFESNKNNGLSPMGKIVLAPIILPLLVSMRMMEYMTDEKMELTREEARESMDRRKEKLISEKQSIKENYEKFDCDDFYLR